MNKKNTLINASNLHEGGAVQVATSIIDELGRSGAEGGVSLVLSSTVVRECEKTGVDLSGFQDVFIMDVIGFKLFDQKLCRLFKRADVVFTVFGPLYLWCRPKRSVVGFAQPWIIYPSSDAYLKLPTKQRLAVRLKYFIQKLAFAWNSDIIIVEADHVRNRLKKLLPRKKIIVVQNALNSVFLRGIKNLPDDTMTKAGVGFVSSGLKRISLGYVGRAYSHKNIEILPDVRRALETRHGIDCSIKVTLSGREWENQSQDFRRMIENVGVLSLNECVSFYRSLDGVIFPSLLECFSATPLEVMAMGLPLYASDRAYVRDFCSDFPFYFNPLDPASIADAVAESLALSSDDLKTRLQAARSHVLSQPSAAERAQKMVGLLRLP